jgi:flagellar biosynthesis/type III secretory pathway protein FliH
MQNLDTWLQDRNERTYIQGYTTGYKNGYEDLRMRVTVELWDFHKLIKEIDSELADTIQIAIDKIEKMK